MSMLRSPTPSRIFRSAICTNGGTSVNCAWRARKGHRHRRVAIGRPGAQPDFQFTQRVRRGHASQSGARSGQGRLAYFDREFAISQDRFKAGDIARVDLDRLELQRVTYESDLQTAEVNLRTAKIQLLQFERPDFRGAVRRAGDFRFLREGATARRIAAGSHGTAAGFESGGRIHRESAHRL